MKTHTLVVYEFNPEGIQFYVIPNDEISEENRELLQKFHCNFVNGNMPEELVDIHCKMFSYNDEDDTEVWAERFKVNDHNKHKISDCKFSTDINITSVIYTGWII